MQPIKIVDEATFRYEMRRLYKEKGYETSLQVLYEFIMAANILADVLLEERKKLL